MTLDVALTCLLIIGARICDVSLGTLRTVCVVNGRRWVAPILGFLEVLVWILVVSKVITTLDESPLLYPIAYATGFAIGNFLGITIEGRVALGHQVTRVFSRRGPEVVHALREKGHHVTEFSGMGRDGPVQMLFIKTRRREAPVVIRQARAIDPECFYIVDDVRLASARSAERQIGAWRSILKRK